MLIELRLDPADLTRWHVDLARRLIERGGARVAVRWVDGGARSPGCIRGVFALERALDGIPGGISRPAERAEIGAPEMDAGASPDLAIDLAGAPAPPDTPTWRVLFDGEPGLTHLVGALLARRMPIVSIRDETGTILARGRPGSETPRTVANATEEILARVTTLVLAALDGRGPILPDVAVPEATAATCGAAVRHAAKAAPRAAMRRAYRTLYRAPHWRIGWRFVDGPGVAGSGTLAGDPWRDLPDDGSRFYADPFPIVVAGRTWLFVEDFEHRLGRGIISAVAFDEAGPVGAPIPVLETDVHLSYPFVFEHEDDVWMIPESWAAGTIDLYRATRFPGGWVREETLVSGCEASDATLVRHGGRWWMMATVRDGGSFSDALHLWSADTLRGPWRPHPANPVLVDIASARPAGRVVEVGGRLVRPVQDCRDGYGAALALAEIVRLDEDAFAQRVLAVLGPGESWTGSRLHTLNRAGRLEVIDGSSLSPRFRRRR